MRKAYPTWFAGGALILYGILVLLPSLLGLGYSFTDWSSYSSDIHWVGLANFKTILAPNSIYVSAIKNTVIFTIATIILKTVIALALALLLTSGVRRLAYLYRALIYLPALLPMVAVGIIFKSIFDPDAGLLNSMLRLVGLGGLAQHWLTNLSLALWSVIGVDTWKGVGYIMVILIAGILAIPREYYESASLDGASSWQAFIHITLPLLRPVLAVTTVLNLLYALRVFDIVYVLTNGGPGYATETVYTTIFNAFSLGQWGVATALSTVFLIIMIALGYVAIRVMSRPEVA
ncbi:MAG: sugar ABC transporter permease [Ktedonobacterales bacterium]|nr:sugar ABC transporter permease [Ktedonobacteraceae bacterium]MBA3823557.1 sugar ABC transporter permease [Ktedonobacterales bacterium]